MAIDSVREWDIRFQQPCDLPVLEDAAADLTARRMKNENDAPGVALSSAARKTEQPQQAEMKDKNPLAEFASRFETLVPARGEGLSNGLSFRSEPDDSSLAPFQLRPTFRQ